VGGGAAGGFGAEGGAFAGWCHFCYEVVVYSGGGGVIGLVAR
jgi:hypothetical protein